MTKRKADSRAEPWARIPAELHRRASALFRHLMRIEPEGQPQEGEQEDDAPLRSGGPRWLWPSAAVLVLVAAAAMVSAQSEAPIVRASALVLENSRGEIVGGFTAGEDDIITLWMKHPEGDGLLDFRVAEKAVSLVVGLGEEASTLVLTPDLDVAVIKTQGATKNLLAPPPVDLLEATRRKYGLPTGESRISDLESRIEALEEARE